MNPPNQHDTEIPILTDILHEDPVGHEVTADATAGEAAAEDAELLREIEEEISARITAELSDQIPILIEAALQEHLPLAAEAATEQVAGTLAQEIGALLEQRLEMRVREVVAQEFSRLQQ